MMVFKFYISPDDDKKPVIVEWDEAMEDYIFTSFPEGLTRSEMIDMIEEVKRITGWEN